MRYLLLIMNMYALLFYGQDTTVVVAQYPDGNKMLLIIEEGDSTYQYINQNGKRYMEKQYLNSGFNGSCIGWFDNGEVKFEKTLIGGVEVDTTRYYDQEGELIATILHSDTIEELFQRTGRVVFCGTTHSSSVVHGGMELPGGGSNDRATVGPMRFRTFIILHAEPNLIKETEVAQFTTDFDGNFYLVLPPGKYRLVPKDFYERQLKDSSLQLNQGTKGWWETWSGTSFDLENGGIYDHVISYSFVGVAP